MHPLSGMLWSDDPEHHAQATELLRTMPELRAQVTVDIFPLLLPLGVQPFWHARSRPAVLELVTALGNQIGRRTLPTLPPEAHRDCLAILDLSERALRGDVRATAVLTEAGQAYLRAQPQHAPHRHWAAGVIRASRCRPLPPGTLPGIFADARQMMRSFQSAAADPISEEKAQQATLRALVHRMLLQSLDALIGVS